MKLFTNVALPLLTVVLLAVCVQDASAQYGYRGGFPRIGGRGFYGSRLYSNYEKQPYFALYPPVYYSHEIVRRPYGYSPFALPPGVSPAELRRGRSANAGRAIQPAAAPTPQMIENPFYQANAAGKPATSAVTAGGQAEMIQNPFYQAGPQVRPEYVTAE